VITEESQPHYGDYPGCYRFLDSLASQVLQALVNPSPQLIASLQQQQEQTQLATGTPTPDPLSHTTETQTTETYNQDQPSVSQPLGGFCGE